MPIWGPSLFPAAIDAGWGAQVDLVDTVWANHPNTLYNAIVAIETKLNIDNALIQNTGGLKFDPVGQAASPGVCTLWIDNTLPGFPLMYTDSLGGDHNLIDILAGIPVGIGYTCPPGTAVGDLMNIDITVPAGDTLIPADASLGFEAHGIVDSVYGAGVVCDLKYCGEIVNPVWALIPGNHYFLDVVSTFIAAPPAGPGPNPAFPMEQEIGYARNPTTLVFIRNRGLW